MGLKADGVGKGDDRNSGYEKQPLHFQSPWKE
jgi:hypothetical protein